jgi:hypothetical protein
VAVRKHMNFTFLNKTIATLASGIASGATSATLAAGSSGLFDSATVSAPIRVIIWDATTYAHPALDAAAEIFDITAASGTAISTMSGAKEGTSAAAHNTSGKTYKMAAVVTKAMLDEIQLSLSTTYAGDPNGNVNGYPGRMCYDTTNSQQYVKRSAVGTLTGWE